MMEFNDKFFSLTERRADCDMVFIDQSEAETKFKVNSVIDGSRVKARSTLQVANILLPCGDMKNQKHLEQFLSGLPVQYQP